MIQFEAGSSHSAKVVMTNPTNKAFDYTSILYMGITLAAMAEVSFSLAAGESKEVTFDIVMPTTEGEYPVYISVFSGGVLLGQYQATENVIILPAVAEFYMPPTVEASVSKITILRIPYNRITWSCLITNKGGTLGTHALDARCFWNGTEHWSRSFTVTLSPGESYEWSKTVDVWQSKRATCKLQGDWAENNYSEGVVT